MTFGDVIGLGRDAIFVTLVVAAPVLLLSMIVGLVISIFQAVTQIVFNGIKRRYRILIDHQMCGQGILGCA